MLISHRFDSKPGSSLLFKVLIVSSGILRNRKRDWNKDLSGFKGLIWGMRDCRL